MLFLCMENIIETDRLVLRRWLDSDAGSLYKYASDPDVGTAGGWPAHTSVENSLEVIRTVFSAPETYAVVLKDTDEAVGCCGLVPTGVRHSPHIKDCDAEIGYWIGKPYWGMGLIPEAVMALANYVKDSLGRKDLWIAFFDGNDKSRRVAEKCGFVYHHTESDGGCTEHFYVRRG